MKILKQALKISISIVAIVAMTGCASLGKKLKSLISGDEPEVAVVEEAVPVYSDNPNFGNTSSREYKRMTKGQMEQEAELHATAGSMWQMEGQGAYLFAQNKARRDGDLLKVKVDGTAQHQVTTKVDVIKKLLKRLEESEAAAEVQSRGLASVDEKAAGVVPAALPAGDAAAPSPNLTAKPVDPKDLPFDVGTVPTRIVERMTDGNFRIRGSQPFMIGKREYKVIVTGIIRPEDFNDEGVSSDKLLDPQFDVVSIRRKETL